MSELVDKGDASALEKHYHRACLRYAQRTGLNTASESESSSLIRSTCDEEFAEAVENALSNENVTGYGRSQ